MKILVTGGAGFIGSAVVRYLFGETAHEIVVVDCLSYAADLKRLDPVAASQRYRFEQVDVGDAERLAGVFMRHQPDAVMHLAAETHVDRSIDSPLDFVAANITGTCVLLEAARAHWFALEESGRAQFRFHHISTDEVFGSLGETGHFDEDTPYDPTSPYAASKASADHLVRAWHRTFGLPVIISNTSNNYGPFQFPEKLIPLMIAKALGGEALPVYGDGLQRREWLHVDDHARALVTVLMEGTVGETYAIGSDEERPNIDVVHGICDVLDRIAPANLGGSYRDQISHVTDRPAHDRRYRLSSAKLRRELKWQPRFDFDEGLAQTVEWYLANREWWESILAGRYDGGRLGLADAKTGKG